MEIKRNSFDFAGYQELVKLILETYQDIDGIMASDMAAVAFLNAALALGKKVPEEFAVVAYDGTYAVNMNQMEITTIVQPVEEIADKIVDTMTALVDKTDMGKVDVRIPVKLKKGSTTK